jgi:hypothetical protein
MGCLKVLRCAQDDRVAVGLASATLGLSPHPRPFSTNFPSGKVVEKGDVDADLFPMEKWLYWHPSPLPDRMRSGNGEGPGMRRL